MEQTKQWPPQLGLQPEAAHCWCECHCVLLRWTKSPIADLTQAANNQLTAQAEKHQTKPSHQRHKTRLWAKHIIRVAPPIWLTSCLLPPDSHDESSERMTGVSAAPWSESVSRGSWTDQAYLSMALCAWADPACRSFCHCHNFFSLSRGERREGNVSVKPKQDSKGTRVRPMCVLEIQIPPGLNLWIQLNFFLVAFHCEGLSV